MIVVIFTVKLFIGLIVGVDNRKVNKLLYLEHLRKEKGFTQADLAHICGIDKSYISRAEKHGFCYDGHLDRIASALQFDGDPRKLLEEVTVNAPE